MGGDDSLHCPHPVSLSLWAMLTRDHRNTLVSPQKTIGEAWLARDTHLCSHCPVFRLRPSHFFLIDVVLIQISSGRSDTSRMVDLTGHGCCPAGPCGQAQPGGPKRKHVKDLRGECAKPKPRGALLLLEENFSGVAWIEGRDFLKVSSFSGFLCRCCLAVASQSLSSNGTQLHPPNLQ